MGEAGLAGRLVGGADPVPDHVGDDRRPAVGDHDHFEPVGEGEVGHLRVPHPVLCPLDPASNGQTTGPRAQQRRASSHGARQASWIGHVARRQMAIREYRRKSLPNTAQLRPYRRITAGRIEMAWRRRALDAPGRAIGLVRRRRLVAGRRRGELAARRLAGEGPGFVLVAAEAPGSGSENSRRNSRARTGAIGRPSDRCLAPARWSGPTASWASRRARFSCIRRQMACLACRRSG